MPSNNPRLSKNNFDLLRLLFAGTVCLVHAYQLSGYQRLGVIEDILSSQVAVKAFFVVSGFLIFMSFERCSSITSYASKRIRRIYPAYFTVVMLCAIGLAGISSVSMKDYFFSLDWAQYLMANLSFLNFFQRTLPGVFDDNKIQAVNGALWTLKIEVLFYISVPLFVFLFKRIGYLPIIFCIYLLSVGYATLCLWLAEQTGDGLYLELGRQLPGQLSYFISGAFFYYYLQAFERYLPFFLIGAISVFVSNIYWSLSFLEPFALATVVIFFSLFFYLGNFGRYGDFSYGVYILHFPIIQTFIHFSWLTSSPWTFLISTVLTTLVVAFAMWRLVEKRFLNRSSHYVTASILVSNIVPDKTLDMDAPDRRAN